MTTTYKPAVLFLFRGPQNDVAHDVGIRLEHLSQRMEGLAVAPAYEEQTTAFGSFEVWSPAYERHNGLLFQLRYVRAILKRARSWEQAHGRRLDLIVTSDPLRIGLIGWLLASLTSARLIVEVNGDYGHPANYADVPSRAVRWFKRRSFVLLERFIVWRADGIKLLYPDQLEQIGARPQKKVVASYFDFVDLTPFRSIEETKTVLLAGFPFTVKGVDILIEAFKLVAEQHPAWRLRIVGYYPDPTEIDTAIGGHPAITRSQPVPHAGMPDIMGRCGIYVSASRTEAMGRVLLEAMWSGKARIASDVGGCWTLVEHGVDGFLFESGNVPQLADLLRRLMDDHVLRAKIGAAGRDRAEREFSTQVYCDKTLQFYISVLQGKALT